MKYKDLHDNSELLTYLQLVADQLEKNNQNDLADEVVFATRFAIGSASEFLNEAQMILEKILNTSPSPLPSNQLNEMKSVIAQIEEAFRKIGGA